MAVENKRQKPDLTKPDESCNSWQDVRKGKVR